MDAAIFGLIVADMVAQPMDLKCDPPPPGGMRQLNTLQLTTGGNVCNVGMAMAKLGMNVAAAGMVGDDALGSVILDRLRQSGIDVACAFATPDAQTSATIVAVQPDGERCFFHVPGASALLTADVFRRCFDTFRNCAWLQIGYFGLLPALTADLPELLREVRSTAPGTKIALDTSQPPESFSLLEPILPHVDLFAPSRPEALALTGESDPIRAAATLRALMPADAIVGIKLDRDGCYLDDGRHSVHVSAYEVNVLDTTGAGDTWFAGLLTGLRKNLSLEQSAKLANRVAADCCTMLGASAGVRSYEDTVARLAPSPSPSPTGRGPG